MKQPQTSEKRSCLALLGHLEKNYPTELHYQDSINLQLMTWLTRKALISIGNVCDLKYLESLFKFAPRLLPFATPRMQLLTSKLFTVLFLMDDSADSYPGNYWLEIWHAHLLGCKTIGNNPIRIAMEVIQLIDLHQNSRTQRNLVHLLREFIYAGIEEKSRWENECVPNLDTYLDFKIKSSGVGMAFECLQIAHPELPNQIPFNLMSLIKRQVAALIILSNDLNSYQKELRNGDLNNLVILYHLKEGIKLSSAIQLVKKQFQSQLVKLGEIILNELPIHQSQSEKELEACPYHKRTTIDFISGFERIYALYLGCKHWALNDTVRYRANKNPGY